jgi:hypothetical protein
VAASCKNTASLSFTLHSTLTAFSTLLLAADPAVKLLSIGAGRVSMCALLVRTIDTDLVPGCR